MSNEKNKKAQGISLNVILIAAFALLVLVIIAVLMQNNVFHVCIDSHREGDVCVTDELEGRFDGIMTEDAEIRDLILNRSEICVGEGYKTSIPTCTIIAEARLTEIKNVWADKPIQVWGFIIPESDKNFDHWERDSINEPSIHIRDEPIKVSVSARYVWKCPIFRYSFSTKCNSSDFMEWG